MTAATLIAQYQATVERALRGGLLDRETDTLMDEQERIVKRLRLVVGDSGRVVELARAPWIEIREISSTRGCNPVQHGVE